MKFKSTALLFIVLFFTGTITAQQLPKKKKILEVLQLTNRYFMEKWPDTKKEIFIPAKNKAWASHIWTRAVYYEGLMSLYAIDKKQTYYNYAVDWAGNHNWSLRNGINNKNADDQCCGQTYIDLYLIDKKEERIKDIKASIDLVVKSDRKDDWWWIDALQMAMPVYVKLGVIYNDTSYFRKMYEMYSYTKHNFGGNGLYNQQEHLWWRDKDFVPPYKEPNGDNCYWARGNGWVVAALVRTLQQLPKTDLHYAEYLQDYKDMCNALLPLQRADGFWNVSLHDSTHFGGMELTGTSLFTYGFAFGINNDLLDKKIFKPAVIKAWNGLAKNCIHPDGKLGYVQGTGKEPKESQPVGYDITPDFEDFSLGCLLLAGSEVFKIK